MSAIDSARSHLRTELTPMEHRSFIFYPLQHVKCNHTALTLLAAFCAVRPHSHAFWEGTIFSLKLINMPVRLTYGFR